MSGLGQARSELGGLDFADRAESRHNMTDELIDILEKKDRSGQESSELIDANNYCWGLQETSGLLNDLDNPNLLGSPFGGASCNKSSDDPMQDDNQSSDAREILERLEMKSFEGQKTVKVRSLNSLSPTHEKSPTANQLRGYFSKEESPDFGTPRSSSAASPASENGEAAQVHRRCRPDQRRAV